MTNPGEHRLAKKKQAERLGRRAELIAMIILFLQGFSILARRYKTPSGEIDLIARRGALVVFAEVKARPTHDQAIDAVSFKTRRRIERAGRLFMAKAPRLADCALRYDIISVVRWCPRHLKDAWREGE